MQMIFVDHSQFSTATFFKQFLTYFMCYRRPGFISPLTERAHVSSGWDGNLHWSSDNQTSNIYTITCHFQAYRVQASPSLSCLTFLYCCCYFYIAHVRVHLCVIRIFFALVTICIFHWTIMCLTSFECFKVY